MIVTEQVKKRVQTTVTLRNRKRKHTSQYLTRCQNRTFVVFMEIFLKCSVNTPHHTMIYEFNQTVGSFPDGERINWCLLTVYSRLSGQNTSPQPSLTTICMLSVFHYGDMVSTQSEIHIREVISHALIYEHLTLHMITHIKTRVVALLFIQHWGCCNYHGGIYTVTLDWWLL